MKKGSFASLRSVRPRVIKYNNSLTIRPTSGVIDGLKLYILLTAVLPSTINVYELPIFRPNDYFWANHLKEGEQKWQCYARVIRDIIAEAGDIPITKNNLWVEDKFHY
jgi:hypothetical protein